MGEENLSVAQYGLGLIALVVLAYAAIGVFTQPEVQFDSSGNVAVSGQNRVAFEQRAAAAGSECGNLRDTANVQHLSHHPDSYVQCLKQVDPSFLQQATGQTLEQILGGSGGMGGGGAGAGGADPMAGHHG